MAEAILQTVIGKAVEMAAEQLFQMGSSLYHLQDNINSLKTQMMTLQSYLKDAESKKARNHVVNDLIINIRDLAEDAEDILDTYLPEFERHKTKGPFRFIKHASCIMCYGATTYSFAKKIKSIEKRAEKVQISMTSLGINREDANTGANVDAYTKLYRKNLFEERDSNIVGREMPMQILETKLLSRKQQCRIISIVGQGGVGKTTVAKKIYHKAKNKFQSCAMVYVSQQPKQEELISMLDDIAKQLGLSEDKRKENFIDNLRLFLQQRRFIILLDDIWEKVTWDFLSNVLVTESENGSRIIVTSRNDELCRYMGGESSLVRLNPLSEDEANNLFSNLMFPKSEEDSPVSQALENVGREIVKRCGGLPLAIKVVAGVLKGKVRGVDAWQKVLDSMSRGDDIDDCQKMLALSYEDLPTELKPLFLCFGIFPEDYEILVSQLVNIWVDEKLIQDNGSGKPASIAEDNVEKLIARNLIQVSKRRDSGRIKSCRIHDLLHNLCVRFARESNFFCTWDKLESSGLASKVRRITSNSYGSSENNSTVPHKLRSLFCFSEDEKLFNFIKASALELKFLKFLIIQISGYKEVHLPNQIGKLNSLICLSPVGFLLPVPASILQIKQLRHLILGSELSCRHDPGEEVQIALPSLQALCVDNVDWFDDNWVKKLSNVEALPKLEILKFGYSDLDDLPRIDLSGYQNLVKLHLRNLIRGRTDMDGCIEFPPNLVEVTIINIYSIEDIMERLKRLPKLAIIKLKHCRGHTINFCGENSFPQLQLLELRCLSFKELMVDEIGMPKLSRVIYYVYSWSRKTLPNRLQNLMEIKQVNE